MTNVRCPAVSVGQSLFAVRFVELGRLARAVCRGRPGSISLRSTEPLRVSAHSGHDPWRGILSCMNLLEELDLENARRRSAHRAQHDSAFRYISNFVDGLAQLLAAAIGCVILVAIIVLPFLAVAYIINWFSS